jgi:triosephosphate isomerase (TIM)
MYKGFEVRPPFFEIGPKAYLYGKAALELALQAEKIGKEYGVQIIFTPQYTDIPLLAKKTSFIDVFSQHIDPLMPGTGVGSVLAEAVRDAGARGTLLNHAEKRLSLSEINLCIKRADEVGLATLVCADTPEEAAAIAHLGPNMILAESPAFIGKRTVSSRARKDISSINETVRRINPAIHVLHSAGIYSGRDVYEMALLGAEATGATSGIIKADDPSRAMEDMIRAMREGYDEAKAKD